MRNRGFEPVKNVPPASVKLPERATKNSAGYDFFAYEDVTIPPMYDITTDEIRLKPTAVMTNVKAYMGNDELLQLCNRSSNPGKKGLLLANGVGIVDSDYYSNESNDGNIGFLFWNMGDEPVSFKKGDAIGQGVFVKFETADGDTSDKTRVGGFGSTGA